MNYNGITQRIRWSRTADLIWTITDLIESIATAAAEYVQGIAWEIAAITSELTKRSLFGDVTAHSWVA